MEPIQLRTMLDHNKRSNSKSMKALNRCAALLIVLLPIVYLIGACRPKRPSPAQSQWQLLRRGDYLREESSSTP